MFKTLFTVLAALPSPSDALLTAGPGVLRVDGQWYQLNDVPSWVPLTYGAGGQVYIPGGVMSACRRASGQAQTIGGLTAYAGPQFFAIHQIASMTVSRIGDGLSLVDIQTVPGDIICDGAIADPRPPVLFANGFEVPPLFANGFERSAGAGGPLTIRCGVDDSTTVHSVTVNGLEAGYPIIIPDEVVICGEPPTATFPGPMNPTISSPPDFATIQLTTSPQLVPVTGIVSTWAPQMDSCGVRVRPPAPLAAWPVMPATVVDRVITAHLSFTSSHPAGQYRFELVCNRVINNNQVIIPLSTRTVIIQR